MISAEQLQSFISGYNEDFNKDGDFPTLGGIFLDGARKDGLAISLETGDYDQGFEDEEFKWLKEYFSEYNLEYDALKPAIILY